MSAAQEESFTAWRRFLEAAAAERPLVVVVEDAQWADPALLGFVEHLVDWAEGVALLVVVTARPELYAHAPAWGGGKRNATTLALRPLADAETAQLLAALLDAAALPAEAQAALLERAGGNPLYAEQFVRLITEQGLLTRRGRVVELSRAGDLPLPEGVSALIAARLDTLPAGHKLLLADAAVLGRVFWSGRLLALGERDAAEVRTPRATWPGPSWSAASPTARSPARTSTRSGTSWCAMSPTGRCRARCGRPGTWPPPGGWSSSPGTGSLTTPSCSPTTT